MLLARHVDVEGQKRLHTSAPVSHLLSVDCVLARHLVLKPFDPCFKVGQFLDVLLMHNNSLITMCSFI